MCVCVCVCVCVFSVCVCVGGCAPIDLMETKKVPFHMDTSCQKQVKLMAHCEILPYLFHTWVEPWTSSVLPFSHGINQSTMYFPLY